MTAGLSHATRDATRRHHARFADAAALALLAALVLAFFWKIAFTGRVLAGLDVFAYFYPYRDYAAEALRAGRLPLWNPYLFLGAPLLANSQVAVLYPLHWPLIWLPTPVQVTWSIVLHVWLAGAGTYLLARRAARLRPPAALGAAAILALGGFVGAQVEHLNQLNTSAWLPWLLLCVEVAAGNGRRRRVALVAGGGIGALTVLAGHTQAAYIVFFGAGVYALLRGLQGGVRTYDWQRALRGLGAVAFSAAAGAVLGAGQLLPTLELSRLSVRSGGLPYNEAASFSLKPALILKAFLPPLFWEPPFSEYVAYAGFAGLALAAVGAWATIRKDGSRRAGIAFAGLAVVGVFLAFGAYNPVYYLLYRFVPGFDLFRAPARWLLLYALGLALLAGIGLEALAGVAWPRILAGLRARARAWQALLVLVTIGELFLASRRLAYNEPTAPAAFYSLRTAPAHLLAEAATGQGLFRFLSLSDIEYDPGDLADLQRMYGDCLPEEAVYDLVVATKMKEVLAFNLPLRYRIFGVDGYDGGLLPIQDYVTLERLFLDEDQIWPDGRLRQQLRQVPPPRLLSLLNVKYVMTDKTQDVWVDGVYYDLEHTVRLGRVVIGDVPAFETTHLGVATYLSGTVAVEAGTPVAAVTITDTAGAVFETTLAAGRDTGVGPAAAQGERDRGARAVHGWREGGGDDYLAVVALDRRRTPARIEVRALLPGSGVYLRGMSLIDADTGTHRSLPVHPAYDLVHSGDVKIYENRQVLPRAFAVHRARLVQDDAAALALLQDAVFDPAREVVLAADTGTPAGDLAGSAPRRDPLVRIVAYNAEEVIVAADMDAPGYLVLADTYYPGWTVHVDGSPARIARADLYLRAVALDAGTHRVVFRYDPPGARLGMGISLVAAALWATALALLLLRVARRG